MSRALLDTYPSGATIYCLFDAFAGSTGAPITMTNFAVGDILIYKNGSTTQRSSTAGFTLLDTDGVDFDSITGIHGFSIDLSDNTDSGFFAVGSQYIVVISTVTIDSQTMSFVAGGFRIVAAENTAGFPAVDAAKLGGTTQTGRDIGTSVLLASGQKVDVDTIKTNPVVNGGTITFPTGATLASTTNITAGTIATVTNLTNAPTNGDLTATMKTSVTTAATAATPTISTLGNNTITAASIAANAITAAKVADGTIDAATFAAGAIDATAIAADAIGASELASDAATEIADAVLRAALTESYASLHAAPTLTQLMLEIRALLAEKSVSGTTLTANKLDGSTPAETFTLDDATTPSAITRAS